MMKPEPLSDDEFLHIVEPLYSYGGISDDDLNLSRPVYKAIEAAVNSKWEEMLSKQKPVAWMQYVDKYGDYEFNMHREDCRQGREAIPLYAAPVMAEKQEPYWMIECSHGFTGWWTGAGEVDCRKFNTDPTKGKRFKTKAEAEAAIQHSCQIATEHLDIQAAQVDQQAEIEQLRTVLRNLVVSLEGKYIVSKNTLEAIDAARAALGEQKPTLICPKCKADRYVSDCKGDRMQCPMTATAQG